MFLWNRQWTRKELQDRTGALSQLGGIERLVYCDGKSQGVTVLRVRTAAGLEFSVAPEKGMDIIAASYCGRSLCWHSPAGIVHPAYYDARDVQWVKTFAGGLLCTCGLATAGMPSEDAGEQCGLHGAFSNTPAEHVSWDERWEQDECLFEVKGRVREAYTHGPNLMLTRSVTASLAGRTISVRDSVENQGFRESPLMLVYHLNFGFPFLTEHSRTYATSLKVTGASEDARASRESWSLFEPPSQGRLERVYYHDMQPDNCGNVAVVLVSDDRDKELGILIRYGSSSLPRFVEWKMTGTNHFVLGLEPANCRVDGRRAERTAGTLKLLQPGEVQEFSLHLQVLEGNGEVISAIAQTRTKEPT